MTHRYAKLRTPAHATSIDADDEHVLQVTLWGNMAKDPGQQLEEAVAAGRHPVIAVKEARVGDFNGRSLSTLSSSIVELDPDIPQAGALRSL